MKKSDQNTSEKAKRIFRNRGGMLKTSEALGAGIHPRTLYELQRSGILDKLARGLYRLADLPPLGNPDLVSVSLKIPDGVLCLISALAYHEITTQVPHEVYVALERGTETPRLNHPPLRIFWFSGQSFTAGIEKHKIDGVPVRIYSPEKTIADCFKYRNKIGIDIAIEALKLYRERKRFKRDDLVKFSQVCRVGQIMRPYLEALL
ncbi:MAG TPA: type IV toxin-antitoxin system AbiEi family antitoxin domain-containing protein [Thermodesulfobacteriota bacterium]|nr:type IV toxin-antitoxin system AbiEi family antitoxin domain-containing protein [Thermodesulfobacteriota bacterium]